MGGESKLHDGLLQTNETVGYLGEQSVQVESKIKNNWVSQDSSYLTRDVTQIKVCFCKCYKSYQLVKGWQ